MTTADAYREGLAYGRRIWEHFGERENAEGALRFQARAYTAPSNRAQRARALGELRGYRQAQP